VAAPQVLADGPAGATRRVILAHGAGAAMDTPFMNAIAGGLAAEGILVLRFEFPYMAARRTTGRRAPPDREPVLLDSWRAMVGAAGDPSTLVIGGKSMGGRMASMVADELGVRGLVCLGYPFHPPGRPDKLRTGHLEALATPTLILQGERDPFGTRAEVSDYQLSPAIRLHWLGDGEHSFKPRKASGLSEGANLDDAAAAAAAFVHGLA
jgi:uncharacterized protein